MKLWANIFLGCSVSAFSLTGFALDDAVALKTFRAELQAIRIKLESGKMSATQAQILLSALQARQNNVLIAQNAEILQRLSHESK
ncbi:MAG: hypothetical protein A3F17_00965 [Gammaproteobacteria bacterium RIFCSPHIGHO2_12_FULL_41_15]|nr:MAG: hypothetical protein A3F17_00965 [Gammaproteobacteria bacterium RIFCSPHIGHO2_12_FULL_41_15]